MRIPWFVGLIVFNILRDSRALDAFSLPSPALAATAILTFSDVRDEKSTSLIFGLFLGVMLTASAYLFFIWVVMRDSGQVFLLCLLLCLSINIASTNDLLMTHMGFYNGDARSC